MNVLFACGGTGGHINPAIAVAKLLRQRRPGSGILFVGAVDGMEENLVPREGFELKKVNISNFQRRLSLQAMGHNLSTMANIYTSLRQAEAIINEFEPDVILGTGGYACFPVLRQAQKLGIPTAIHESNAVPGLTTKMVAGKAERIMVCFEESRQHYKNRDKVIVTGTPVREEFVFTKQEEIRRKLGLDDRPLVLSFWGSLGAREMNKKIAEFIKLESEQEPFYHIHATGEYGWRWMPEYVRKQGVQLENHKSIDMREYIYDMPTLMAAADLVICRAGASTISELSAAGKAAIIVPSPNVAGNHQEKNAMILENRGAACVLPEKNLSGKALFETAKDILGNKERREKMSKSMSEMAVFNSAELIYDTIMYLADTQRN